MYIYTNPYILQYIMYAIICIKVSHIRIQNAERANTKIRNICGILFWNSVTKGNQFF